MKFINIGYGSMVCADKIIAVVCPDSAPVKRIIGDAKDNGRVIDATCGHKTKAVIFTDSEHIILCAVSPEKLAARAEDNVADDEADRDDE